MSASTRPLDTAPDLPPGTKYLVQEGLGWYSYGWIIDEPRAMCFGRGQPTPEAAAEAAWLHYSTKILAAEDIEYLLAFRLGDVPGPIHEGCPDDPPERCRTLGLVRGKTAPFYLSTAGRAVVLGIRDRAARACKAAVNS